MNEDRTEAYKEASIELGKGIALGLVPFIGQAIDAYDTVESAIALYQAKEESAKEDAQFDMLLAIVGWVPGPGDGVKKALRIVNKDPQRFAPVLFDLLRFVLTECGIQTSPEALLEGIFNAAYLRAQIADIKQGVQDSSVYQALPQMMQTVVMSSLNTAQASMPAMVGIVEKRLLKWKKLQPNSSARESTQGRAKQSPPQAKDAQVSAQGSARPATGPSHGAINAQVAEQALADLSNEMAGISGEHIADYICAQKFGWGKDWDGHDKGSAGRWTEGLPSARKLGKLSKGGSPKSAHVLYKLSDGANGVGIDAVWRAEGHNHGKKYAIVEAKATKDEDAPKFMRKLNNQRKPSITSTLGVNAISDPSELLEPIEDDSEKPSSSAASSQTSGRSGKQKRGQSSTGSPRKPAQDKPVKGAESVSDIKVQMSREWIEANIEKAVTDTTVRRDFKFLGAEAYSRHLFFCPAYHPSGSPKTHMQAKLSGAAASSHIAHDGFHYDELEVKRAVNKRKASLRKKHGDLRSLKGEQ